MSSCFAPKLRERSINDIHHSAWQMSTHFHPHWSFCGTIPKIIDLLWDFLIGDGAVLKKMWFFNRECATVTHMRIFGSWVWKKKSLLKKSKTFSKRMWIWVFCPRWSKKSWKNWLPVYDTGSIRKTRRPFISFFIGELFSRQTPSKQIKARRIRHSPWRRV